MPDMPGLNKEIKLLAVEPGQTLNFSVEIDRGSSMGVALWKHYNGELFAFWTNQPIQGDARGFDHHGGLVNPSTATSPGSYRWSNESGLLVIILMNSFQGDPGNCTRLQLLNANEEKREFVFGAGDNDKYNSIYVRVHYEKVESKS